MSARDFFIKMVADLSACSPDCEQCQIMADHKLSALRSAGWAVVPVEPTLEMIAAWDRVARPGLHAFEARYKAMITAAQEDSRE